LSKYLFLLRSRVVHARSRCGRNLIRFEDFARLWEFIFPERGGGEENCVVRRVRVGRRAGRPGKESRQGVGRCRLDEGEGGWSWRVVAAASTEIMQLFHARAPVIGCTFAAEVAHRLSVRSLGRETLRCCPGQFLSHEVNGYFWRENYPLFLSYNESSRKHSFVSFESEVCLFVLFLSMYIHRQLYDRLKRLKRLRATFKVREYLLEVFRRIIKYLYSWPGRSRSHTGRSIINTFAEQNNIFHWKAIFFLPKFYWNFYLRFL
jgi:hypothetical protein